MRSSKSQKKLKSSTSDEKESTVNKKETGEVLENNKPEKQSDFCRNCLEKFNEFSSYLDHKCPNLQCNKCKGYFSTKLDLKEHKISHVKSLKTKISKNQIENKLSSCLNNSIVDSIPSTSSHKNIICKYCNSTFGTASLLNRHKPFCYQRKIFVSHKVCILCKNEIGLHYKHQYCRKCRYSILEKDKDYNLRKKSPQNEVKDNIPEKNVKRENPIVPAEKLLEAESDVHNLRSKETNYSDSSNISRTFNTRRQSLGSCKEETCVEPRSDIIIRKIFNKSKEAVSLPKSRESSESISKQKEKKDQTKRKKKKDQTKRKFKKIKRQSEEKAKTNNYPSRNTKLKSQTLTNSDKQRSSHMPRHLAATKMNNKRKSSSKYVKQKYSSPIKDFNERIEKPTNISCEKCGYSCSNLSIFEIHLCQQRLKQMTSCVVKLNQPHKLDINEGETFTYFYCPYCKKDFCDSFLYQTHMNETHAEDYDGRVTPLSVQVKKTTSPNQNNEPADYFTNGKASTSFMENSFMNSDPQPNFDTLSFYPQMQSSTSQIESQFQTPTIINPSPFNLEFMKHEIGCKCPPKNGAAQGEDVKPCIECLQKYCLEKMFKDDTFNDLLTAIQSENLDISSESEVTKDPNQFESSGPCTSSAVTEQTRFPTPPVTPETSVIQSIAPEGDSSSLPAGPSTFDLPEESLPINNSHPDFTSDVQPQNESSKLRFSWNWEDEVDAVAFVPSEEDLTVLKLVCSISGCYSASESESSLFNHIRLEHNKDCTFINAMYIVQDISQT